MSARLLALCRQAILNVDHTGPAGYRRPHASPYNSEHQPLSPLQPEVVCDHRRNCPCQPASLFTYEPDTRIKRHPVEVGQDKWTAVNGIVEGTVTKPKTTADGKVIPPNGKSFKLPMAPISHWTKDGPMNEEQLFWDKATFMTQLGLAKYSKNHFCRIGRPDDCRADFFGL
jgi:hypothetical protein